MRIFVVARDAGRPCTVLVFAIFCIVGKGAWLSLSYQWCRILSAVLQGISGMCGAGVNLRDLGI